MKKEKRLLLDTLFYGVASFGSKFLSFVLIPIYSKYFTKFEFGEWDLISTTFGLISPFISLEIMSALYRWLLESKEFKERISIISTTFAFLAKSIFIFTIIYFIATYFYKINYLYLIYLMFICSQIDDYLLRCLRGMSKSKEFAKVGILKSITAFITAMICIYIFKIKIETFIYSSIISSTLGIILGVYYSRIWIYIKISKKSPKLLKEMKQYSFPLVPGAINWWIMNASDRYIILYYLGMISNGTYAMANKFPSLLAIVNSIFLMAWQDNALKEFKNEDKNIYYSQIFKYYSRVMYFMVTILVLLNRSILEKLLSQDYSNVWKYSNFLYIAALFSFFSSFWGIGFHGNKNTNIILKTTLLGAVINVGLNVVFIKKIGLYAAVLSTIICYLIMWIYRVKQAKNFKISINVKEFMMINLILVLALWISFFENIKLDIIMLFITTLSYFILNYKKIKVLALKNLKLNFKN